MDGKGLTDAALEFDAELRREMLYVIAQEEIPPWGIRPCCASSLPGLLVLPAVSALSPNLS